MADGAEHICQNKLTSKMTFKNERKWTVKWAFFFIFIEEVLRKTCVKNVKGIEFEQNMIADNKVRLKKIIS